MLKHVVIYAKIEGMNITFYDDPIPQSPEEVRLKQLGLFVYEDLRRVAVGFELTPFLERPSVDATITNSDGIRAASLTVVDTLTSNFSFVMHLRDETPTDEYEMTVVVYYATPETERQDVHEVSITFPAVKEGEQRFSF